MANETEYVVVVHKDVNLEEFDAELAASTGEGPIPNREVKVANPRWGSKRMTHWMLTDAEVNLLKTDERVLTVEIPADQRTDITIGLHATQTGIWYRGASTNSDHKNWGLRRVIAEANSGIFDNATTLTGDYTHQLTGTGVDFVVQDSGIQADHPEFNDEDGNTRVQQINWYTESGLSGTQADGFYTDYDGHGTHCAGIAAGKTFGWAKNSRVYSQKLGGLEGTSDPNSGISITNAFDTIRIWHNNKPIDPVTGYKRPTVVNMSWGYGTTKIEDPASGTYRGAAWTYGVDYSTRAELESATGVNINRTSIAGNPAVAISVRVTSVDAEIEEMISDGIHVIIAAGNNYNKIDSATGSDYNNQVVFGSTTYSYHRGSSPYSTNAFMVASSDTTVDGSNLDKTSIYSSRGPGCNIWAPGTYIMSATSNDYNVNKFTPINYGSNASYKQMSISGTSMAAPQVAGLCCLHLEVFPDLAPAEIQKRILGESKEVMSTTSADNDYQNVTTSIMGQSTKFLYSKYNSATPWVLTGPSNISIGN